MYHHLLMMSMNLSDIAILNIKGSNYDCVFSLSSENKAINLLKNIDLTEKSRTMWIERVQNFLKA